MNEALLVIDYTENACIEEYQNPRYNLRLSKVRDIASSLEKLVTFYRTHQTGEVIWIKSCLWLKKYLHPNIVRFYDENPEAEFYSVKTGGDNFYHIRPEEQERIFEKNMYDAFSGTQGQLDEYLKKRNIGHLIICGIYSTGCVNATICEAFHIGYKLTIIKDCVETFDEPGKQAFQRYLLNDWSLMYGRVIDLSQFIKNKPR
jgi:nicotinamidase-related amidase